MACPGKNCCLDVIYTTLSDLCYISFSQGGIPRELRSEKRHYGKKLEEFVCPGSGFATIALVKTLEVSSRNEKKTMSLLLIKVPDLEYVSYSLVLF